MDSSTTVMGSLLCILFPLCSSVRIGLPEDHVDVSSCLNRACISEHDWQDVGEKWHNFRDTVRFLNDSSSIDQRSYIWRIFQEDDIWNGNIVQDAKNLKKIRTMSNYIYQTAEQTKAVQRKDMSTRYDHQAVIMMEGDITVQKAAHFIYNKHPLVSTLYKFSPETNTIDVIAGEEHFLGKNSRVQIVGHGRDTFGEMRLSEKTPQELAEIVHKLPIEMSELSRVSLVGCNIGNEGQSEFLNDGYTEHFLKSLRFDQSIRAEVSSRNGLLSITASGTKETGKIQGDGIQWFSKDSLSKTVMKLGDFNEIIRIEMPITEGIRSYSRESSGALVKLTDINENTNKQRIFMEKTHHTTNELNILKVLEARDIDLYIKTITRTNFLHDIAFVKEKIIEKNIAKIRDNVKTIVNDMEISEKNMVNIVNVKKNEIESEPGRINYHEFVGNAYISDESNKRISDVFDFKIQLDLNGNLRMFMSSSSKEISFFLDSGIPANWKYVARLDSNFKRIIKVENVREIASRSDLLYEINMFGAFGIDMRNMGYLYKYYRFGDIVYKMSRKNFYITWEGMIASDMSVRTEHFHDQPINENEILHLNNWKWVDSRNRYILPKDYKVEKYPEMKSVIKTEYANRKINEILQYLSSEGTFRVTEKQILDEDVAFTLEGPNGLKQIRSFREGLYPGNVLNLMSHFMNGERANIKQNQMHFLEGSTVLAIGLSEPIRNFRTFLINEMMMSMNANEPISLHTLIECNPMTRGKSWGFLGYTGLTVNEINHRGVQKQIVLPRELNIARTYLLTQKGKDGQNNKYKFLSEQEFNQLQKEMPSEELARITSPITKSEIQNTVAEYKPKISEPIVRTKPLGDYSSLTAIDLEEFSEISSSKAMPIRASVAMIDDYINIVNHVSKVIAQKNQLTGKEFEIIKSTIEIEDGTVKFFVRDKANPSDKIKLNIEINEDKLKTKQIKTETANEIESMIQTGSYRMKSITKVNNFLGIYGIVMGIRGAVIEFEEGKIGEGIVNIAQSVHVIYGMSQSAQRAFQRITSKLLRIGLEKMEVGLSSVSSRISTFLSRGASTASETLSAAGRVVEDIPILGTAFGVYNTVQDIRRKTTIGYIDAGLDAAITISALFGPEALVVTVALTIVRLVIDDFYYAIGKELNNLPSDASVLQKIGAVFKGIGEGIVLTIKKIYDFTSLGFLSFVETYIDIDKRYKEEHALFHKMSDFHNYLHFVKRGEHEKVIDFAAGDSSWNGGNIIFQMFDDNTARLRMQIVDDNGKEKIFDKFITLEEDANDIILGIGESHDISFKKESAKLFWLFPLHSQSLIDKFRGKQDTLHGTYYGNSKDNKFFTIQNLTKDANLGYSLADYYYEIYGEDGDDTFFLGPQRSIVKGGNGRDTYVIPYSGGKTTINNYATDLKEDLLFIDVDFEQIHVDRIKNDLILKHGHEHDVTILDWFSGHRMGHLTFKAKKGVIFNVTLGVHGRAFIMPVAVVLTGSIEDHVIDVSKGLWEHVVIVIGSDANDRIVGNKNNNLLNGGKGSNTLYGGTGSDTYLINSAATSSLNIIDNFDTNLTVDKVILESFSYEEIIVSKNDQNIRIDTTVSNGPIIIIKNWFKSEYYRHCVFVTKDDIIFKLTDDINDSYIRKPIILDASQESASVILNAAKQGFENVTTIIGSNFDDVIIGSNGNNYLKGGRGFDKITGGEGRDVYVIHKGDSGDFIDNFAEDGKDDLLLVDFEYNRISVKPLNSDVVLKVMDTRIVTIKKWMKGENWRHIVIRTIDGISFRLEISASKTLKKLPLEVDKSAMTTTQIVNTNNNQMRMVEHITGSNASDTLVGNEHENIIDPGFGGAYMMGIDGHDIYVIKDHYNGPNIVNNFARDNLTDIVKLPTFFKDVCTNISKDDLLLESISNPSASVTLQNYKTDPNSRHLVIKTMQDGVVFTIPEEFDFQPTAVSIDRTNQAHNLIIDLDSSYMWSHVVTVLGSKIHSNVIKGNDKNNTITGGALSDTLEGGDGNDVIRGNQGDDFIDGGNGDDILAGGAGKDWIDGGLGDDVIYPGPDSDYVNGGPGFDVIVVFGDAYSKSGVYVDLHSGHGYNGDINGDIYISIEGVIGSFYNDILVGNNYENYLDGKEGNDILFPHDGNDILVGGAGKDIYDISNSKGEKVIRNYADDSALDVLNLRVYERNRISLEKRSDTLVIHIGIEINNIFCPSVGIGPIHIKQWYKHSSYQHLIVQLAGSNLILDNFYTGDFFVEHEQIDTQERKKDCELLFSEIGDLDYSYYSYNDLDHSDSYNSI